MAFCPHVAKQGIMSAGAGRLEGVVRMEVPSRMRSIVGRRETGGVVRRGRGDGMALASKPIVRRLSAEELRMVLPWSGTGTQLIKEVGTLEDCTARMAFSLIGCWIIYATSIEVASVVACYWAWAPIYRTVVPNFLLRLRYRYAGIWSARILNVRILPPPKPPQDVSRGPAASLFNRLPTIPSSLQLVIGDGSHASFEMQVPITDEVPEVQVGEFVNLLVVSDKPSLSRFKTLPDVYFPDRQMWISEKSNIERQSFEQLQEWLTPFTREKKSQGRANGRPINLYLEEKTLSRDGKSWEQAVEGHAQPMRSKDLDYVADIQEKRRIDDKDLYV